MRRCCGGRDAAEKGWDSKKDLSAKKFMKKLAAHSRDVALKEWQAKAAQAVRVMPQTTDLRCDTI